MTTSVFPTDYGQSGFADSTIVPVAGSTREDSAHRAFYPEAYDRPPRPAREPTALRAFVLVALLQAAVIAAAVVLAMYS
jgi:hypothetical protein